MEYNQLIILLRQLAQEEEQAPLNFESLQFRKDSGPKAPEISAIRVKRIAEKPREETGFRLFPY